MPSRTSLVHSKVSGAARDLAGTMTLAARDLGLGATRVASSAAATKRLTSATRVTLQALPKEAVPELARSVRRMKGVRTPAQAQ